MHTSPALSRPLRSEADGRRDFALRLIANDFVEARNQIAIAREALGEEAWAALDACALRGIETAFALLRQDAPERIRQGVG